MPNEQDTELTEYCEHDGAQYFYAWCAVTGVYERRRYCGECFDDSNLANCEADGCPLFTLSSEFCREHTPAACPDCAGTMTNHTRASCTE